MIASAQFPGFIIGVVVGGAVVGLWVGQGRDADSSMEQVVSVPVAATEVSRNPSQLERAVPTWKGKLEDAALERAPMLRAAGLTQLGYDAAGGDLDEAMRRIDGLTEHSEKLAFLRGIFTRVAQDKPPFEAIQRVKRLERSLETEGFRALISEWTGDEVLGVASFDDVYGKLLKMDDVSEEVKSAWLKAYQDHPKRSEMLALSALELAKTSPSEAESVGAHLQGWEREQFLRCLAREWIPYGGESAWKWVLENRELIGAKEMGAVLDVWYGQDSEGAMRAFDQLADPAERLAASEALGMSKASDVGTEQALAWADSLPTPEEQAAAHEAIYAATPRGIGAMLSHDEGAVIIRDVMEGTPAAEAGLRSGDRLVEIDPGMGEFQPVGSALDSAVELIRGEPGTGLRVRVLRADGQSEVVDLNRQQLIFESTR